MPALVATQIERSSSKDAAKSRHGLLIEFGRGVPPGALQPAAWHTGCPQFRSNSAETPSRCFRRRDGFWLQQFPRQNCSSLVSCRCVTRDSGLMMIFGAGVSRTSRTTVTTTTGSGRPRVCDVACLAAARGRPGPVRHGGGGRRGGLLVRLAVILAFVALREHSPSHTYLGVFPTRHRRRARKPARPPPHAFCPFLCKGSRGRAAEWRSNYKRSALPSRFGGSAAAQASNGVLLLLWRARIGPTG